MEGNAADVDMVQRIPIRFGDRSRAAACDRDPDSLASSDRYTREGLMKGAATAPGSERARAGQEAEPQPPTDEEVAELRKQLDAAQRQCRGIARDLENYRRHTQKELASARHDAEVELLSELGDVVRSLELAMETADRDADSVLEGVQMVARGLAKIYEGHDLERIPTVGHPFDPSRHEAVLMESSANAPGGTILRELSPGFISGDRVIRPAKVSVAD